MTHLNPRPNEPRIPVHTVEDAPPPSRDHLASLTRRMGTTLNIHGEMAHPPLTIAGYAGLQAAIKDHGTFDVASREAIALAVGATDECAYCQSAHTLSGRAAGLTDDQMLAIRRAEPSDDTRRDALLAVARETAGRVGDVTDNTWQRALDAGWTTTEPAELYAHVAVNLYTNYFNHLARTRLDVPAAPGVVA
ncbi:carboxymuconolactone decarboxylase family protein [Isoptericola halotolerans]|uniref:carboxymuconolactone decarboxylase family protein n=1 Tax=Isoptericola halotolerans TaxID=300560 RepID=UPI003890A04B